MAASKAPAPPRELGPTGRALWRSVTDRWELAAHEERQLLDLCATADLVDRLAAVVASEGVTVTTPGGDVKTHPALVELRQARLAYARLAAAMRFPDETGDRPQRRTGVRGVYRAGRAYR